jgi:proteasome alpha subunit
MFTPYDWNQTVQQKSEYIEDRLRDGSPVVGLSCAQGMALITVKRQQRKVFEIYDRLMFAALGNQSDIETVRMGAIDVAHTEGYTRSPEDVTAQRVVGFAVSPPMKRAFADPFAAPFVVRAIFAELGRSPEEDRFYTLDYNGEYACVAHFAVVGGTAEAEAEALKWLGGKVEDEAGSIDRTASLGLLAWACARQGARGRDREEDQATREGSAWSVDQLQGILKTEAAEGEIEIGILERETQRERRFRLVGREEFEGFLRAALA